MISLVSTNYERAFAERPRYTPPGYSWTRRSRRNGSAPLRARHPGGGAAAAVELLLPRPRDGPPGHFGEQCSKIALDHRAAGLDEVDIAVMDLAELVVDDATEIDDADLQRVRDLGLTETEIMDVVLAAAARCFFSKTLDALGVRPDAGSAISTRSCAQRSWSAGRSPTTQLSSLRTARRATTRQSLCQCRPRSNGGEPLEHGARRLAVAIRERAPLQRRDARVGQDRCGHR